MERICVHTEHVMWPGAVLYTSEQALGSVEKCGRRMRSLPADSSDRWRHARSYLCTTGGGRSNYCRSRLQTFWDACSLQHQYAVSLAAPILCSCPQSTGLKSLLRRFGLIVFPKKGYLLLWFVRMQSCLMPAFTAVFTCRAVKDSHLSETTHLGGCPPPANDGVSISYVCLSVELLEDIKRVAHHPGREE